jgi:hypothetical protein
MTDETTMKQSELVEDAKTEVEAAREENKERADAFDAEMDAAADEDDALMPDDEAEAEAEPA